MGNKKRIIFLIFAVGLALALALGILYSWMAFMPTGFDSFQKTAKAARERIKSKSALSADAVTSATIAQAPVGCIVGHNGKSGPPHKLDFFEELATFDSYKTLISGDINRNEVGGGYVAPSEPMFFMARRRWQVAGTTLYIDNKSVMGKSLWAGLEQERRDSILSRTRLGFRRVTLTTPTTEQAQFFNQYLDKYERFLLRPHWNVPTDGIYPGSFLVERLALFAIARASMSGDQERAMAILDGYLKAQGVLLARASAGPSVTELFFGLTELPGFPAEGWLRARRALDAMRLSEADIADIRRIRAEDFFTSISAELARGEFQKMGNMWHFLYGGKVESIANTALLPIALRKAEQISLSLSRADFNAFDQQQSEFRSIMGLMNARGSLGELNQFPQKILSIGETNDRIDGALLILDAACAMHDGKPLPALSRRGIQQLEQFTMQRFGTFELGQSWAGPPPADITALIAALNQYSSLHKNSSLPATPEAIKAFIKENNGNGWEKYVDWHDARPVYLVWGPSRVPALFLNRYDKKKFPNPDQLVEVTQVHAFALDPPIISDEMKKLLARPVQSALKRGD